jgi:DNA-binding transcriptional regulator YiaG
MSTITAPTITGSATRFGQLLAMVGGTARKVFTMAGIPADEIMTPAELRVVREWLGLTGEALALLLGVQDRTVRRWEAGQIIIPDGARLEIEQLEAQADTIVEEQVLALNDARDPVTMTYRTNEHYWQHHPEQEPRPASWHRAITARIAQEVPGLSIVYRN